MAAFVPKVPEAQAPAAFKKYPEAHEVMT